MMEKLQNKIPLVRFPEFKDDWEHKKLDDFLKLSLNLVSKPQNNYLSIGIRSHFKGTFQKPNTDPKKNVMDTLYSLKENNLIVNITFAWEGAVAIVSKDDDGGLVSHRFPTYAFEETTVSHTFFQYLFFRNEFKHVLGIISPGGAGRNRVLNKTDFLKLKCLFPTIPEQKRIANFFTVLDNKIKQLKEKKALLEEYKKGMMQKILSQEIRFKDDDGKEFENWGKISLYELTERITNKNKENNQNVLTISAQYGLVNQLDYFNNSVSSKNLLGYYLIKRDDFAYNRSYSKGYPMGATKRLNNYEKGVVSTLYICFRFKKDLNLNYFEHYFESGSANREIEKYAQEGARNHGLLNIGLNDFFSIELFLPKEKEQTKIANFLTKIDDKVNAVNVQLEESKEYKKGLLQKMCCV